jgi:hypothetical protein
MLTRFFAQLKLMDEQLDLWESQLTTDPWAYGNPQLFTTWRQKMANVREKLHLQQIVFRNCDDTKSVQPIEMTAREKAYMRYRDKGSKQLKASAKSKEGIKPKRKDEQGIEDWRKARKKREAMDQKDALEKYNAAMKKMRALPAGKFEGDRRKRPKHYPSQSQTGLAVLGGLKRSAKEPSWASDDNPVKWSIWG